LDAVNAPGLFVRKPIRNIDLEDRECDWILRKECGNVN
jgi:hypothetical protein